MSLLSISYRRLTSSCLSGSIGGYLVDDSGLPGPSYGDAWIEFQSVSSLDEVVSP
jgi:hypothetical protein